MKYGVKKMTKFNNILENITHLLFIALGVVGIMHFLRIDNGNYFLLIGSVGIISIMLWSIYETNIINKGKKIK